MMLGSVLVVSCWFLLYGGVYTQTGEEPADPSSVPACPSGRFGVNCSGVCHCLNGNSMCGLDQDGKGVCLDYQCDRGWTNPPFCQTVCPPGMFGPNCESECHCQAERPCNIINGLCPGYVCNPDWTGPSCQTRKPRLVTQPVITEVSCRRLVIQWRQWNAEEDLGQEPIASYTIQYSLNGTGWEEFTTQPLITGKANYTLRIPLLDQYTTYQFRVIVNRDDNGKAQPGLPSPMSDGAQPACPVPTTTSTTPEPTTTSTTTTTTLPPTTTTTTVPTTTTTQTTTTTVPTTTTTTTPAPIVSPNSPTTVKAPAAPPAVTRLRVIVQEGSRVFIQWDAPSDENGDPLDPEYNGPATFRVTSRKVDIGNCQIPVDDDPVVRTLPATDFSLILGGYQGYSTYQVTVVGLNVAGESEPATATFLTPPIAPVGSVENFRVVSTTSRSATLRWDPMPCARRGSATGTYRVHVFDSSRLSLLKALRTNQTTLTVNDLSPYTLYFPKVAFENGVGVSQEQEVQVATLQDVPPAPTNLRVVNVTSTAITVRWDAPAPPNGVLEKYEVAHLSEDNPDVVTSFVTNDASSLERIIDGLEPYVSYVIRVQAKTGAQANYGWGPYSDPVTQRTDEGQPGPPHNLHRIDKNSTCITVQWLPPVQKNGVIYHYSLSYEDLSTSPASRSLPVMIKREILEYVICGLLPAHKYRILVSASTRLQQGPSAILETWTNVGKPPAPPKPTVINITATHITIIIQPIVPMTGPVSRYYIIIAKSPVLRRRRQVPGYDPIDRLGIDDGYTAAMLSPTDLTKSREFIIGDNKMYGEFLNRPLSKDTDYELYFVVESSLDGFTEQNHVQMSITTNMKVVTLEPPTTTTVATTTTEPPTAGAVLGAEAIIGMAVGIPLFLLLLLLLILLICCCSCRNKETTVEEDDMKATWLDYYSKNYGGNSLKKSKNPWSDTHELNQSRHLTINDDKRYTPQDIKVSDIQNKRPTISFEEEYAQLPQGHCFPCNVAQRPENVENNRFEHLLAYDHSRVVLRKKNHQGYINANYIQGYHVKAAYIAAQSPFNESTIEDFWQMVFQEKVSQVVFMCRLVEDGITKSEQYWPDQGVAQFGKTSVSHVKTEEFANFIIRTFDVKGRGSGNPQRVTHYQFTAWPDHGCPDDPIPFLDFRMKVKTSVINDNVPLLVHCGTGVSRTAVFIAVDSLMEQAKLENQVNVFKFVERMRRDRTMMVRILKQYIFIYDALFEALITNYNIVGEDLRVNYRLLSNSNPLTDKSYFREQFEVLEEFVPQLPEEKCIASLREQNLEKNRFKTITPLDEFRPILKAPLLLQRTDYINATFIDSYTQKNAFIITQTPMTNTLVDFWKMIYDFNINTIVMLNNSKFKEESCAQYWPPRMGVEKWDPFFVSLKHVKEDEHFTIRTLELNNARKPNETHRKVRQFQFESWNMYEKVPWSREGFMRLMERVDSWREKTDTLDQPVVVHCMDGASQSGLYAACFILCEKMIIDGEVNVFHTVKHLKRRRPHCVNTLEQYKFCFKLLWDYMNTRMRGLSRSEEPGIDNPSFSPDSGYGNGHLVPL